MADIRLTLRLFGGLRDHLPTDRIVVSVPSGSNVAVVRSALGEHLASARALIAISALANEHEVLDEQMTFDRDAELAVLPPVCGG